MLLQSCELYFVPGKVDQLFPLSRQKSSNLIAIVRVVDQAIHILQKLTSRNATWLATASGVSPAFRYASYRRAIVIEVQAQRRTEGEIGATPIGNEGESSCGEIEAEG